MSAAYEFACCEHGPGCELGQKFHWISIVTVVGLTICRSAVEAIPRKERYGDIDDLPETEGYRPPPVQIFRARYNQGSIDLSVPNVSIGGWGLSEGRFWILAATFENCLPNAYRAYQRDLGR